MAFPGCLCRKQGEDAVLKPGALLNQVLALTVRPLGVLLSWRGHPHRAADLVVAANIGSQHSQQALGVKPVGPGPARPTVHQDARRLDTVGRHPVRRQQSMQPEAIPPRFDAASKIGNLASAFDGSPTQIADQRQLRRGVAGSNAVHPAPGSARQARATSQIDVLSSMAMWAMFLFDGRAAAPIWLRMLASLNDQIGRCPPS